MLNLLCVCEQERRRNWQNVTIAVEEQEVNRFEDFALYESIVAKRNPNIIFVKFFNYIFVNIHKKRKTPSQFQNLQDMKSNKKIVTPARIYRNFPVEEKNTRIGFMIRSLVTQKFLDHSQYPLQEND